MKAQRIPAIALFTGALLAVSAPISLEGPSFGPEEGSSLSRTFATELDLQLDSFSLQVNGEDMTGMMGDFEFSMRNEAEITVSDTFVGLGDGQPTKLERTFDELEASTVISVMAMMGQEDQSMSSESELEGKTVVFEWDDDEEDYKVTWEDGEEDEEVLGGLTEDMDLRALLPDGEVSKGDSWTIELSELTSLATPGGNLKMVPEDMDEAEGMDADMLDGMRDQFGDQFAELFEGECTCTFKEVREVDGEEIAEITVEVEIASAANVADMLMEFINGMTSELGGEAPEVDIESADINLDFTGEGTLLWNLGGGHASGFDMSGEAIFGIDLAVVVEAPDGSQTIEASIEMSGSYQHEAEMEQE